MKKLKSRLRANRIVRGQDPSKTDIQNILDTCEWVSWEEIKEWADDTLNGKYHFSTRLSAQ